HTLYGCRSIEAGVLTEKSDPFSYTAAGARWVNHEWLSELAFGWTWMTAGEVGLVLLRNLAVLLIAVVVAQALRRSQAGLGAGLLLVVISAECLSEFVVFVRPQLVTFVLFTAWLYVLRNYWDCRNRAIWWLPPTMMLRVNCHGGFLAGLGILFVVTGCSVIRAAVGTPRSDAGRAEKRLQKVFEDPSTRELGAVSILSAVMTFVNPYGLEMHQMLWTHLITDQAVREWQPLWSVALPPGTLTSWSFGRSLLSWAPFLIVVPTLVFSRRWKWIDLAILVVVGWQAVSHLRHVALLILAALVLLPGPLTDALSCLFSQLTKRWIRPEARPIRVAGVVGSCAFLAAIQIHGSVDLWRHGVAPWQIAVECRSFVPGVPVAAVRFLKQNQIEGNLVTDYGWGQFVIWHCFPGNRVAFDGRYRTVYPPELEQEFFALQVAFPDNPATTPILDRHSTEIALVPKGRSVEAYLTGRTDFRLVYSDAQASVFVRNITRFNDLPGYQEPDTALLASASTRWTTFPGLENGTCIAETTRGSSVHLPATSLSIVGADAED
ncbi:MAG: hypothetical protein VB858_20085, partial [Planctomycetaceae bacterium]